MNSSVPDDFMHVTSFFNLAKHTHYTDGPADLGPVLPCPVFTDRPAAFAAVRSNDSVIARR